MTPSKTEQDCCRQRGWTYPDGGKRCHRHSTADDRALVAKLDREAKPILGTQEWPYGPNIDVAARQRLVVWAQGYGLKLANSQCQELHWLRKGSCAVTVCQRDGSWMDHVTRWTRVGKPAVLISQPYGIANDSLTRLGALADAGDLNVHVSGNSWYGHGTVAIEVWREDTYREMVNARTESTHVEHVPTRQKPIASPQHVDPSSWPEIADGAAAPQVCDGCHASVQQLNTDGHVAPCADRGTHAHHIERPIEDCLYWHEYAREQSAEAAKEAYLAAHPLPTFLDVPCPRCKAKAGEVCVFARPRAGAEFHAPRMDRQIRAATPIEVRAANAWGDAYDAYSAAHTSKLRHK